MGRKTHTIAQFHVFLSRVTQMDSIVVLFEFFWSICWDLRLFCNEKRTLVLYYNCKFRIHKVVGSPKWSMVELCTSSAHIHMIDSALESPWWVELIFTLVGGIPVLLPVIVRCGEGRWRHGRVPEMPVHLIFVFVWDSLLILSPAKAWAIVRLEAPGG